MKNRITFVSAILISVSFAFGQSRSEIDELKNMANLYYEIGEYQGCIEYCDQNLPAYIKGDDAIAKIYQNSIDSIALRQVKEVERLSKIFDFKGALDILESIDIRYSGYKSIPAEVAQYNEYVNEQRAGRMVSSQLAKILTQYDEFNPFHDGWARVKRYSRSFWRGYAYNFVSPFGAEYDVFNSNSAYLSEFSDGKAISGDGTIDCIFYSDDKNRDPIYYNPKTKSWHRFWGEFYGYAEPKFHEGYIPIYDRLHKRKWGYFGNDKIIKCEYDRAWPFHEGRALVFKGNHAYFIDESGNKISENVKLAGPSHWPVAYYSEGLVWVLEKDKKDNLNHIAIDKSGKVRIKLPYIYEVAGITGTINLIYPFNNGLSRAWMEKWNSKERKFDKYYVFFNNLGELVCDEMFDYAGDFSNGLAVVKKDGYYGYINSDGKVVIPYQFSEANDFKEGLASVRDSSGKFGYINKAGEYVIPSRFDWAYDFSEGFGKVEINKKWGFVDKFGFCTIDYPYSQ